MIEKASIYTMNALNKSSDLWHTNVNRKARPVVEGEHDKSWNDHGVYCLVLLNKKVQNEFLLYQLKTCQCFKNFAVLFKF